MKQRNLPVLFLVTLVAALACRVMALADSEVDWTPSRSAYESSAKLSCGPQCIAFLCRAHGRDVSYDDVLQACPPGPSGTSLNDLAVQLEKSGFHVRAFDCSPGRVHDLRCPSILHLWREERLHFVVLLGPSQDERYCRVFDPGMGLKLIEKSEALRGFQGIGLAVADFPLPDDVTRLFLRERTQAWFWGVLVMVNAAVFGYVSVQIRDVTHGQDT